MANPWDGIPLPVLNTPIVITTSGTVESTPPPSAPVAAKPSVPTPSITSRDRYIENTLNESRAAEYFFNNDYQNDIMSNSDSRTQAAVLMSNNITVDMSTFLSNYVDFDLTDEVSRIFIRLQKVLIAKFFKNTKRVYIKGSILALLDSTSRRNLLTYDKDNKENTIGLLKQKADGSIDIDNGKFLRLSANKDISSSSSSSAMDVEQQPPPPPEETMSNIELRLEKISKIKKASVFNINLWVYNELPLYQFANTLAGASGIDNVNAIIKVNIGELIYIAWNEIYSAQFNNLAITSLDSIGLFTVADVTVFVDMIKTRTDIRVASTIVEYIKQIDKEPVLYIKFILTPSYQVPLQRAWNVVEGMLKDLHAKNPFARGFATYRIFVNPDTKVPDQRLVLLTYPKRGSISAQPEFTSLVVFYENQQRNIKQGTNATKNQIVDMDRQHDFILKTLVTQLQSMGFT